MRLEEKLDRLEFVLEKAGSAAIAFSGGVDSTFLLRVAKDVLNNRVIAVTVNSPVLSSGELSETVSFARKLGVNHIIVDLDVFDINGFSDNPPDRCYLCKREVFKSIFEAAAKYGISYIADGSNTDDIGDYRPGMAALRELGVKSPLMESGFTKNDIRVMSQKLGLTTWNKPAFACLASRVPYGEKITKEKLEMIEKAELFLLDTGFNQVRVRHHGDIARIEVAEQERPRFFDEEMMNRVNDRLKEIGFKYVALDLRGYRTGSLNEGLKRS